MNMASQREPDSEGQAGEPATESDVVPARRPESRARLVVELTRATSVELDDLVELEELNKTTIVNRALQVYAFLRKAEREGAQVLLMEAGDATPQRIRFL
jgi:hypothetical protein